MIHSHPWTHFPCIFRLCSRLVPPLPMPSSSWFGIPRFCKGSDRSWLHCWAHEATDFGNYPLMPYIGATLSKCLRYAMSMPLITLLNTKFQSRNQATAEEFMWLSSLTNKQPSLFTLLTDETNWPPSPSTSSLDFGGAAALASDAIHHRRWRLPVWTEILPTSRCWISLSLDKTIFYEEFIYVKFDVRGPDEMHPEPAHDQWDSPLTKSTTLSQECPQKSCDFQLHNITGKPQKGNLAYHYGSPKFVATTQIQRAGGDFWLRNEICRRKWWNLYIPSPWT